MSRAKLLSRYSRAGRLLLAAVVIAGSISLPFPAPAHAADGASQLSLPWTAGQSWSFYGPHNWGDVASAPWNSLDFSGGDSRVLAASGGTVHFDGCNKSSGGYLRVDHGGGWQTTYYHLTSIPSTFVDGQTQVSRGDFLGNTGTVTSCWGGFATGAHVHFSVWYVGGTGTACPTFSLSNASCQVDLSNFQIDDNVVTRGIDQYYGCLTSTVTLKQFCSTSNSIGGPVYNDGSIAPLLLTVNDTSDAAQASPGTACVSTRGTCTLRAAVQAADQSSNATKITIPGGTYSLSIPEGSVDDASGGDLHLSGTITLAGAGASATIVQNSSSPVDRVFNVANGATVTISGLTVQNGTSLSGYGGGIVNQGSLTLSGLTVSNNSAGAGGGGISNLGGTLAISGSTVTSNSAPGGGGISLDGVGGSLSVSGSNIINNLAVARSLSSFGGGLAIHADGAKVTLDHTAVNSNTALNASGTGSGGGIAIRAVNDTVTLTNSSVSGNTAVGGSLGAADGGGIVDNGNGGTSLSVTNSSISGNAANASGTYARGGGLSSSTPSSGITLIGTTVSGNMTNTDSFFSNGGGIDLSGAASVLVTNSTISGNSVNVPAGVTANGGGINVGGHSGATLNFTTVDQNTATSGSGVWNSSVSGLTLSNSIVSGNPNSNCYGVITDQGYNLDSGFSCGLTSTGDISGTDPALNHLANNGGPTMTEAPASGSPAIDAANPSCPPPATDQRGGGRPFTVTAARCDIGSVEFGATVPGGGGSISILTAIGVDVKGFSGTSITATVATFTDNKATGNPSDYGATISWGDGGGSSGQIAATSTGGSVQGTHTFAAAGTYPMVITITKVDGASVTVTAKAHIITHYTVEVKGWIPQRQLVDPLLPIDGTPYPAASIVESNCPALALNPVQVATTRVMSRFGGDGHVRYPGSFRGLETIDFDWDGSAISNVANVAATGVTTRFKTYWIPFSPNFSCRQTGKAPTTDMHGRVQGSNSFVIQICCSSGRDPLVPSFSPSYHVRVIGTVKANDELDYSYDEAGFPTLAVQVSRNRVVNDTTISNDASCLTPSDVLGPGGIANLTEAFLLGNSGKRALPRAGIKPVAPRMALVCPFIHLPIVIAATGSAATAAAVKSARATIASRTLSASTRLAPAGSGPSTNGNISGTVTSLSGSPLGGICAAATDPFGNAVTTVTTSNKGAYSITGLTPSTYEVRFEECANGNHLTQWYNAKDLLANADPVTVTAGVTTSGINASLGIGGTITGLVTNSGGSPLANICAHAQDSRGHFADSLSTGTNGTYSVGGLPTGNYVVSFTDCPASDYLPQYYAGASTPATATPVAVTSGATTPNINVSLVLGAIVTGTVTSSGGSPLGSMCVTAFDVRSGGAVDSGSTSSTGTYTLDALPTGKYAIQFTDCNGGNHTPLWYNGKGSSATADILSVTNGVTTSGINAVLATGGTIAGTITDTAGNPLAGVCADAEPLSSDSRGSVSAATGSTGTYSITALPTGSYTVEFVDCSGGNHMPQWYNAQGTLSSANTVGVTAGATVSGINGQLAAGGTISGTVTAGGTAVANVCIDVQDLNQNEMGSGTTDSSGQYNVAGLPTGDYKVSFADCLGGSHSPQWYSGQPDFSTATTVHVTVGAVNTGINASLATNGAITGTVIDASAHPLADVCVTAQVSGTGASVSVTSDPSGTYTIGGLPAGSYLVDFRGCSAATQGVIHQWYSNALDPSTAAAVTVAANATTAGINATLAAGGSITGTVTDSAAVPLANICVEAFPTGTGIAQPPAAATDSAGHYSLPGVAGGSYTVSFSDCTGGLHLPQYYNGQSDPAASTVVQVTAGSATTGINASLASGGAISGKVTSASSGAPLPGICVDVFPSGGALPIDSTAAAGDGTYRLSRLPAGRYNVEFSDCVGGGHTTQWANNQSSQAAATVITVTAGLTTSGVNAALGP